MKKRMFLFLIVICAFSLISSILLIINISISNDIGSLLYTVIGIANDVPEEMLQFYTTSQVILFITNIIVFIVSLISLICSYNFKKNDN